MLLPWCVACSTVRLTYGQGPTLAYWWLDGYVDFTSEQAPRVRQALDDWFAWHRATQLPGYAALLATAQRLAVDDVTPAVVCQHWEDAERRLERAVERALPAMAEVVATLEPSQVDHLEQRYAKADAEIVREHLQASLDERREKALRRVVDRAESFYGPLDDAQRRLLADALAVSPFDARIWLDERQARQRDLVAELRRLLAERADAARIEPVLQRVVAEARHSPRPAYRAYRQRLAEANCALVARLHNQTSAAQRQRLVARLKGWEADLRSFVPGAPPTRRATPSPVEG
jgi:hypothetical protein